MRVENIVFLLEERSSKNLIDSIVPKILPDGVAHYSYSFDGKSDLEQNITRKMRGWLKPNTVFLVMRDQDSADCKTVKKNLMAKCADSRVKAGRYLVRIACHELESFFLGDLDAVRAAVATRLHSRRNSKMATISPMTWLMRPKNFQK